ncbi:hypothetical protein O3P69_019543 [Scylla paramamosain]|uniref:Calcineurin-like phosphoesterase domain-containing protein n=1 Tax=Scylla paramamosain TaxID=85552 RepID=A0AAW0T072_SCYPA
MPEGAWLSTGPTKPPALHELVQGLASPRLCGHELAEVTACVAAQHVPQAGRTTGTVDGASRDTASLVFTCPAAALTGASCEVRGGSCPCLHPASSPLCPVPAPPSPLARRVCWRGSRGAVRGVGLWRTLNSQFWQDRSEVQSLAKEQDDWLDKELEYIKTTRPVHAVIFQHIPPFIESIDERTQYFNLPSDVRKQILGKFIDAGVKYVFCGHYHRNAGGEHNGPRGGGDVSSWGAVRNGY